MEIKKIELNDELKQKIKATKAIGFKLRNDFLYVPQKFRDTNCQIPKEYWTVFKLKSIMGIAESNICDDVLCNTKLNTNDIKDFKIELKTGAIRLATLRQCILGWKNFYDEDLNLIPIPVFDSFTNTLKDESLNYLSSELQVELYNAIVNNSTLTEEELRGLEF